MTTEASKIALNLERFRVAVNSHDRENPPPHGPAYGIGLAFFDMDRLGLEEGEMILPGIKVECDGGQSGNLRVLCPGVHAGEGEQVEETVRNAAGVGGYFVPPLWLLSESDRELRNNVSMSTLRFTTYGKPQPKGAHTSFVPRRKDGSLVTRIDGAPVVVTKDTNDDQQSAQQAVALAALAARTAAGSGISDGPVTVNRRYYFARGKGHYGTGRNAGLLKDSAPLYPVTKADIDKLDRLVFDALTGTIIRDDKLVVGGEHSKHFAEGDDPPRTEVEVSVLEQQTVGVVMDDSQLALAA
jgi:Holliday junction resolvase RusA-like endonuclease